MWSVEGRGGFRFSSVSKIGTRGLPGRRQKIEKTMSQHVSVAFSPGSWHSVYSPPPTPSFAPILTATLDASTTHPSVRVGRGTYLAADR